MLWKDGEKKGSAKKLGALAKLPKMPSGSLESARRAAGRKLTLTRTRTLTRSRTLTLTLTRT